MRETIAGVVLAGMTLAVNAAAAASLAAPTTSRVTSALNTARIEELTGAKGAFDKKEGVFKVLLPRTDLSVMAAGVHITPPLGLSCWAAFEPAGAGHVMAMGDLVLLEEQVNPVMSVALDNGLEVTALHNHFFWDTPRVMFMHIAGMGSQDAVASAVGKVFAKIKEPSGSSGPVAKADIEPSQSSLNAAKIEAAIGKKGELSNGVYKVTIGRKAQMHGHTVGTTMGVNTWAAFAGTDERAVVDGDFAVLEPELQPVLKALRQSDIQIVAIHSHMTGERPRVLFLHYWGIGPAESLAHGLRSALDLTKSAS